MPTRKSLSPLRPDQMENLFKLTIFPPLFSHPRHTSGPNIEMPLPSIPRFVCVCLGCALLNVALFIADKSMAFGFMPMTIGSLPLDVLFFFFGIVAKRNRWLDDWEGGLPALMDKNRIWVRLVWVVLIVTPLVVSPLWGASPSNEKEVWEKDDFGDDDALGTNQKHTTDSKDLQDLLSLVVSILLISFTTLVLLDFFKSHMNCTTKLSKMMSETSYTVYIIHPFIVVLSTYLFQVTYTETTGNYINFVVFNSTAATVTSSTKIHDEGWLWGGWLFACVFSCVVTYLLGYWIRKIPGLKKIL